MSDWSAVSRLETSPTFDSSVWMLVVSEPIWAESADSRFFDWAICAWTAASFASTDAFC